MLLCSAIQSTLQKQKTQSRIMYGKAAWLEVMEDHSLCWAGHFNKTPHFWIQTEFAETVDLHLGAAYLQHSEHAIHPLYSPPNLWSKEIPKFCRYVPEGVAEFEVPTGKMGDWLVAIESEIVRGLSLKHFEFPNEPFLCPDRKLLDDSESRFAHYYRALSVRDWPKAPI